MRLYLKTLIITTLLLCAKFSFGQLNIKVGYSFAYTEGKAINNIFDQYNDANPWLEQKFSNFNYFNGLDIGLRYKWHNLGICLDFSNLGKKTEGLGTNPNNSTFFSDKWNANLNGYTVGLESNFGVFGWGANIGYKTLKFETDISGSNNNKTVYKQRELNSKFYISLSLPSNSTAISIQPYIQIPLKKYNLHSVEQEIFSNDARDASLFDEELVFYGVSVIFYNGPQ